MRITQVRIETFEHREFLLSHGDRHITTASHDYFAANTSTDVLLEAREDDGKLIGLSFASGDGERSITVVHRDCRGKGVATPLMREKRMLVPWLKSRVSATNTASMRLGAKVYSASELQTDGRVKFFDEAVT